MPYAVSLSGIEDVAGVLVLLDDRAEAEAIAIEVQRAGHKVEVRSVGDRLTGWRTVPGVVEAHT